MSELIRDWVAEQAASDPSRIAIEARDQLLSYGDLDHRSASLALSLKQNRISLGDRVAVLAQNSVEFVEAVHSVPRAGGILVPLNTRLTTSELAFQLKDSGTKMLLCHAPTAAAANEAATTAGIQEVVSLPLGSSGPAANLTKLHRPDDIHSIVYTSGTTGTPKGSMLTFGNFTASAAASGSNLGVEAADRWLACMPLFHVGGLSIVTRSAIYGTCAVIQDSFDERAVNKALRETDVTLLSVVATMLQRMLDADEEPYPSSVRAVLVGGGPVPEDLIERSLRRGLPVSQTYGLTEATSQVSTLRPGEALTHLGSAGRALQNTRLDIDAPTGESGEILVQGPTVSPGYWNDESATGAALSNGWFHTGDIGRLDADGFLYVLDRRDDLIVSGGENVYPAEIEAVLLDFPGIEAAAVVGLPDEHWGQAVTAAIVTKDGEEPDGLASHVRKKLAGYKVPLDVLVVDSLPMTASGKVQRRLVRDMLTAPKARRN